MIEKRLARLRALMKQNGMSAYYIPTSDFHLSEYTGAHFKARAYLSGFTGSAGTLVVLMDEAALWVDGRYFLQGEQQLSGTPITLERMGEEGVPTIEKYLLERLEEGAILGMDGRTVSADEAMKLERALSDKSIEIDASKDLVGEMWEDRPPLPAGPAYVLGVEYAGRSAADKLSDLRKRMAELEADVHIIATLDDIAWLFNIRGTDVAFNPLVIAYAVIEPENAYLFADEAKFASQEIRAHLDSLGVRVLPYGDIYTFVEKYEEGTGVLMSDSRVNYTLYEAVTGDALVINAPNPTRLAKAMKNPVEIENLRRCHVTDGLALTRFMRYAKENVGKVPMTEVSLGDRLDAMRGEGEGFIGLSFPTICGYAEHGAIVHYRATEQSDIPVEPRSLLLVDSGGHYFGGTTDVTRTFAMGPLTDEEKKHFAIVLRGMLSLAAARFPHGVSGSELDILARSPFWAEGLDYRHGTGHGVGYLLNVHEAPPLIKWTAPRNNAVFEDGMVTSDEPGMYIEGSHGVRIENQLVCHEGERTEFGRFMNFEVLTLAPIDLDAVDPSLLNDAEKRLLNEYHALVYEKLAPLMDDDEREWLRKYTRAI